MNTWPALIALSLLLFVALCLVAWAAFTLGNPKRPYPRRPLPLPKKRKKAALAHPRHQRQAQVEDQHLASGYVTTRRIKVWDRPK